MTGGHYSVTGAVVNGQPLDASVVKAALDNIDEAAYQTNRGYYPFKFLSFDPSTTLTIAGGVVSITQGYHKIANEGGASSDTLDTINGGVEGQLLFIKPSVSGNTTIIGHNTGNIWLSRQENMGLTGQSGLLLFFDGAEWTDAASIPFSVPTSDILAVQVFS